MTDQSRSKTLHSLGLLLLKVALPAGIFAFLLWSVEPSEYQTFFQQPKRWELILLAQATSLAAVMLGFVRWRLLVRAFEIPFSIVEAMRLGFIGYLLNFVSFGSVGGDLFKAVLVAKQKPHKRPEAVASILLDRALGLLGLVTLAMVSLTVLPIQPLTDVLLWIRNSAALICLAAATGLAIAIYAGKWFDSLLTLIERLPMIGESLVRMARAIRLLRGKPLLLCTILVIALAIHGLLATSVYFVSRGLYAKSPSYAEHLLVVPPGMAAGALPLAPGGIGYQEAALAALFVQLDTLPEGFSGTLVATVYRLMMVTIAGIGLLYYWFSQPSALIANESPHITNP